MIVNFKHFFKTGQFGTVELGDSIETVIEVLGDPDGKTHLGDTGVILTYGWYEFFFIHTGKLHSIQNDNYIPSNKNTFTFKNNNVEFDTWFFNATENQSIEKVSQLFDKNEMEYQAVDYYGRMAMKLNSGIIIEFAEENNQSDVRELVGFRYWS